MDQAYNGKLRIGFHLHFIDGEGGEEIGRILHGGENWSGDDTAREIVRRWNAAMPNTSAHEYAKSQVGERGEGTWRQTNEYEYDALVRAFLAGQAGQKITP